jgi:hypothetical protein
MKREGRELRAGRRVAIRPDRASGGERRFERMEKGSVRRSEWVWEFGERGEVRERLGKDGEMDGFWERERELE